LETRAEEENEQNLKTLFSLRLSLCLRVGCIFVIFNAIDEKQACETCVIGNGPLLPPVIVRVLTYIADELSDGLEGQFAKNEGIRSDEFPFRLDALGSFCEGESGQQLRDDERWTTI